MTHTGALSTPRAQMLRSPRAGAHLIPTVGVGGICARAEV